VVSNGLDAALRYESQIRYLKTSKLLEDAVVRDAAQRELQNAQSEAQMYAKQVAFDATVVKSLPSIYPPFTLHLPSIYHPFTIHSPSFTSIR